MIEKIIKQIIDNLGATGLLVVGLYFLLSRPLEKMARHLQTINEELGNILKLLEKLTWQK
jgi:hypothetical protein